MSFTQGLEQSTDTEALIACYTHMIDRIIFGIEHGYDDTDQSWCIPSIYPREDAYLGAARAGFDLIIDNLSPEVREHVEKYLRERLILAERLVPADVIESDVLFGVSDPYGSD